LVHVYESTVENCDIYSTTPVEAHAHQPAEKGDLNCDGKVTPADAAIVLRMAVSGECSEEADVSGDHKVTSLDALMILQLAAA